MRCAQCSSDNLTRLSVIWERGTSTSTGQTYVAGVASTGYEGAYATTTTQTRTRAAESAAPPQDRDLSGWMIVLVVFALFFLGVPMLIVRGFPPPMGWLCFFLFGAIPIWRVYAGLKYNFNVVPALVRRWQSQFQCNRCGYVGVPMK